MSFDEKKQADTKGIAIKHSNSSQMHSRTENSHERAMNIARTCNPKNRSRLRRREDLPERRRCGKTPQHSGTFRLMQRPETRQRSMVVAVLQSRRREEEEEEGTKGKRKEITLRSYL